MKKSIMFCVLALLLSVLGFVPFAATAGDGVCATDSAQCNQGEAFAVCQQNLSFSALRISAMMSGTTALVPVIKKACTAAPNGHKQYDCDVGAQGYTSHYGCFRATTYERQDYTRYGAACIGMPPLTAKLVNGLTNGSACLDGCIYNSGQTVPDSYSLGDAPAKIVTLATNWAPTGAVCDISGPDPEPKDGPECLAQGGLTQCVKNDGSHCATASTGKQFCWGKGDGEPTKDDGADYANRGENGPAAPPAAPPAGGGTWGPPQNCVPMSSVVGGYTRNYTVCGGTSKPPGTTPPTNPPPAGPCDPTKGPCGGSASGGASCDAAPVCAGDAINCAVLEQVWRNRCSGNGNKASGGQCTAEGGVGTFSCSGDQILCRQAMTNLEQKCRSEHGLGQLDRDAGNGIDDQETPDSIFSEVPNPSDFLNGSRISFASGELFPSVTLYGRTWSAPPEIYSILGAIRLLIIAGFTFYAITKVFS